MSRDFIYSGSPAHIVFGEGKSAAAGEWVERTASLQLQEKSK